MVERPGGHPALLISSAEVDRTVHVLGEAIADAARGVVSDEEVAPYAGW
jgi:4-aminobutyrate aminotransferase